MLEVVARVAELTVEIVSNRIIINVVNPFCYSDHRAIASFIAHVN